ncbi:isocitrate/isopropylmalate family dehydrogenase [Kocuria rhizophila]|nr:isocitrate/isopropylmalate family dehydrogenase [Kocuria rhizophila]
MERPARPRRDPFRSRQALNDKRAPSGILDANLLLKLRFGLTITSTSARPPCPGTTSSLAEPGDIDFVVVREGTEATRATANPAHGHGARDRHRGLRQHGPRVRRLVRYTFELARSWDRKKLTLVHKHNVLVNAGRLTSAPWTRRQSSTRTSRWTTCTWTSHDLHDHGSGAFSCDRHRQPLRTSSRTRPGLVTGGIGLAPSGNINADRTAPSMFEPVHGPRPGHRRTGTAQPTARSWRGP